MDARLEPLRVTVDLNRRLFLAALYGVDDSIAIRRPNEQTNHMAFIACHLLDARHFLTSYCGRETEKPFKEVLDAERFEDITEFPPIQEIKEAWSGISEILYSVLSKLEQDDLAIKSTQSFPVEDRTVLGGITFLLEHEAYHIGQIGLLRRFFGLSPMKYS